MNRSLLVVTYSDSNCKTEMILKVQRYDIILFALICTVTFIVINFFHNCAENKCGILVGFVCECVCTVLYTIWFRVLSIESSPKTIFLYWMDDFLSLL